MSLKSKLDGNTLDLSLSELNEPPPTKQLLQLKKATEIDFSCNKIRSLPDDFGLLTHVTRLDLSQNQLTSLPDSFGNLTSLVYLDLYKNQLSSLPLTLGRLKALKWLDVKDNPLDGTLQGVAGDCLDAKQCQAAAKNVVQFLQRIASDAERMKQKHLKQERERENIQKQKEDHETKAKAAEKKKQKELRKQEREQQIQQKRSEELMDGGGDILRPAGAGRRGGGKKGSNQANGTGHGRDYIDKRSRGCCGYVWLLIKTLFLVGLFSVVTFAFMASYCATPATPAQVSGTFAIPQAWCQTAYAKLAHWQPPDWLKTAGNQGLDYVSIGLDKTREGLTHVPQMINMGKVWPYLESIPRPSGWSNETLANAANQIKQLSNTIVEKMTQVGANVKQSYPYWLEVGKHYAELIGTALIDIATAVGHYVKVYSVWLMESAIHFWNTLPEQWENAKWLWRNMK